VVFIYGLSHSKPVLAALPAATHIIATLLTLHNFTQGAFPAAALSITSLLTVISLVASTQSSHLSHYRFHCFWDCLLASPDSLVPVHEAHPTTHPLNTAQAV
jgi:hypothetical protein